MKKKTIYLNFIFIMVLGFILLNSQTVYGESIQSNQMELQTLNDVPLKGNLTMNSELLYPSTIGEIDAWQIDVANNETTGSMTETDLIFAVNNNSYGNMKPIENRSGGGHHQYRVSMENIGNGLRVYSSNNNAAVNNDNSYISFSQEISVRANTQYIIQAEAAFEYSNINQANGIQLVAYPTDTVVGSNALVVSEIFRPIDTNRQTYSVTFDSGENTTVYIAFRIRTSGSNNSYANVHSVKMYANDDYDIQHDIKDLFLDEELDNIEFLSKSDYYAIYDPIFSKLNDPSSEFSEETRLFITEKLDLAKSQRDVIDDLDDRLDALYTSSDETEIRSSVDNETMIELKADIDALTREDYQNVLLERYQKAFDMKELQDAKTAETSRLEGIAESLKQMIEAMENLNSNEIIDYQNQIDQTLAQEQSKINQATEVTDVSSLGDDGQLKLENVFLLASQVDAKNALDAFTQIRTDYIQNLDHLTIEEKNNYITEIEATLLDAKTAIGEANSKEDVYDLRDDAKSSILADTLDASKVSAKAELEYEANELTQETISPELRAIIDHKKQVIDNQDSVTRVETEKNQGLFEINLQVSKEMHVAILENYAQGIEDKLDTYVGLTSTQLDDKKQALENMLSAGISDIQNSDSISDINQATQLSQDEMDTFLINAKKQDAKQTLAAEKQAIETIINQPDNDLTEEQKEDFVDQLEAVLLDVNTKIDQNNDLDHIAQEKNLGTQRLQTILLSAYKQDSINALNHAIADAFEELDTLLNVDEQQINEVKQTLENIADNTVSNINNAPNKSAMDAIINSAKNEIELELDRIKTLDESNLEEVRTRYLDDLETLATHLKLEISDLASLDTGEVSQYQLSIDNIQNAGETLLSNEDNVISIEQIKSIYQDYAGQMRQERDQAQLRNIKNESKSLILERYQSASDALDALSSLSEDEHIYYQGLLDDILNESHTAIDDASTVSLVQTARSDALEDINAIYPQAYKQHIKNDLLDDAVAIKAQIDELMHLSSNRQEQLKNAIDAALLEANSDIDESSDLEAVLQISQDTKAYFRSILTEGQNEQATYIQNEKNRLKDELSQKADEVIEMILDLDYLTDSEKQTYEAAINSMKDEGIEGIDASDTLESAMDLFDEKTQEMNDLALDLKKEDAKREIEDRVLILLDGGTINETLAEKIIDIFKNVNDATTYSGVDAAKEQGLIDLSEVFEEELAQSRNEVRQALEEHARKPIDANVENIIAQHVDDVTTLNYNEPDSISAIIESGKLAIDNYYLDRVDEQRAYVKDILDDYAGRPVADHLATIIQDYLEMIDTDNYDDEQAVSSIVENAKQALNQSVKEDAKEAIDQYVEDLFGADIPSSLETLIDQIKTSIDEQNNVSDVWNQFEQSKGELDDYKDQAFQDARTHVRETLSSYAGIYVDDVEDIIAQAESQITSENYQNQAYLTQTIDDAKSNLDTRILFIQKETAKNDLLTHAQSIYDGMSLSSATQALLEQADTAIDQAQDKENIDQIYHTYAMKIIEQFQKEISLILFESEYEAFKNSGRYAQNGLEELEAIYEQALIDLENTDLSVFEQILLDAINDFDDVKIYEVRNGDFSLYQLDLFYQNPDGTLFAGVRNQSGIAKNTHLEVMQIEHDLDAERTIMDLIRQGALFMPTNTMYNKEDMVDMLVNHQLFRQLEIRLVDQNGQTTTNFEGVYEVSFLLPEELERTMDIRVVYLMPDGVKLFETTRMDNWITFKTEHFSMFYVIGYETTTAQNIFEAYPLAWIIMLLLLVIIFEVVAILVKHRNNQLRLRSVAFPVLFFGISGTWGITLIWILTGIIILLALYLIYLFIIAPPLSSREGVTHINYQVDNSLNSHSSHTQNNHYDAKEEVKVAAQAEPKMEENDSEDNLETHEEGLSIIYNYSFEARMHQAPLESQERFSMLKNYILSYPDVEVRKSWKYERFMYKGKPILKAWIHGNNLKLYFNIEPKALKDSKYNIENVSYARMHETTPSLLTVNGPRLLTYAKELVDMYMQDKAEIGELLSIDYTVPYIKRDSLVRMNLIKVKKR